MRLQKHYLDLQGLLIYNYKQYLQQQTDNAISNNDAVLKWIDNGYCTKYANAYDNNQKEIEKYIASSQDLQGLEKLCLDKACDILGERFWLQVERL